MIEVGERIALGMEMCQDAGLPPVGIPCKSIGDFAFMWRPKDAQRVRERAERRRWRRYWERREQQRRQLIEKTWPPPPVVAADLPLPLERIVYEFGIPIERRLIVEKVSSVAAIQRFFTRGDAISPAGGAKVTIAEMKAVPKDDREELGALAAIELGVEIEKK